MHTGAVRSVLPRHVCDRLGLAVVAERVATYADGREDVVGLTGPVRFGQAHALYSLTGCRDSGQIMTWDV